MIGDVGYAGLRVEDIAAEAKVAKSSLYRRWSSKSALVVSVVEELFAQRGVVVPESDDVWTDLESVVRRLTWSLRDTRFGAALAGLVFERSHDPELRSSFDAVWAERRENVVAVLRTGVDRGQIRSDVDLDLLADLLAGLFYYRLLISNGDLSDGVAVQVLALVRQGVGVSAVRDDG